MKDVFETKIGPQFLSAALVCAKKVHADPLSSVEMEKYFLGLEKLIGCTDQLESALDVRLKRDFRWIENPPVWIQSAEWPIEEEMPMLFVDQTEIKRSVGLFHDDAIFFVFYSTITGNTKVVIQVA